MFEKDKEHGTANSYNKGCRCDRCKKAKSEYRKNTPIKGHGTKWYYDKGCRCDLCREAKNIAKRKQMGSKPRKKTTDVEKGTRICYDCKVKKKLSKFGRSKNVFMGREYRCKKCRRGGELIARKTKPEKRYAT